MSDFKIIQHVDRKTDSSLYPVTLVDAVQTKEGKDLKSYIQEQLPVVTQNRTTGEIKIVNDISTNVSFTADYIFNVNSYNKRSNNPYRNAREARRAIPSQYRRYGLVITYSLVTSTNWVVEQFYMPSQTNPFDDGNWELDARWKEIGSSEPAGPTDISSVFSALRKLQAEVAMLRNSFRYGINSYTGTTTAISAMNADLTVDEDEPLWSIEEEDLSEISGASVTFDEKTKLYPINNIEFNKEGTQGTINGKVYWDDSGNEVRNSSDSKIFMFYTATRRNLQVLLNGLDDTTNVLHVDYTKFDLSNQQRYNILVVVSRKVEVKDEDTEDSSWYGKNYIWTSISGVSSGTVLKEGYLNFTNEGECDYLFHDTRQELSDRYYISSASLKDEILYKMNFYSKYQDFSHEVIPQKPTDEDYKYKVAHLTIRSVTDNAEMESVANYLQKNELIYKENDGTLWIKTPNGVKMISGSSKDTSTGMKESEIIELLVRMGIVAAKVETKIDINGNEVKYYSDLHINDVCDINFIHTQSGKKFNVSVNSEGQIIAQELSKEKEKIATLIIDSSTSTEYKMSEADHVRGLSSRYFGMKNKSNVLVDKPVDSTSSAGVVNLNSDRVKIGAYYAPLATDKVFGCSHAFIELENTSEKDFSLEGCYLHWLRPNKLTGASEVIHHALSGVLKGGSTYLIRGKQYSDPSLNANTFINVEDYDEEWYETITDGAGNVSYEILDMSITPLKVDGTSKNCYGIALTYGMENLTPDTSTNTQNNLAGFATSTYPYIWRWWYIDSLAINAQYAAKNNCKWTPCDVDNVVSALSNTLVKNTFELDPAKQAYQALNTKDSSRVRGAKYDNDIQYVNLTNEFISFPNSDDTYPVSKFTPKSSKHHKNVCSDKSKLDAQKPNMVTCSFGTDVYKERCFNWISVGSYKEYLWLFNDATNKWDRFESYDKVTEQQTETSSFPRRKEYSVALNNSVYAKMYSFFPADGTYFTAHKCVIKVSDTNVGSPKTYKYRVGRGVVDDVTREIVMDTEHVSDEQTFTIYPTSYKPRIYQISDQQGFHWIEYQVWEAAANKLNKQIAKDQATDNIIPVLINTGDMTQNGTRINEWFDYYSAGKNLFNHIEQMNVVGNNDLCGTTPTVLGTGDDTGKSNSYYFHLFYCYDSFDMVDSSATEGTERRFVRPLIKGSDGNYRYIPSLYYFDFAQYRFLMVNSEITETNCKDWFKKTIEHTIGTETKTFTVNVYTGWQVFTGASSIPTTSDPYTVTANAGFDDSFTTIYTMLYDILSDAENKQLKVVVACHEMPFTVITNGEMKTNQSGTDNYQGRYRSLNGSSSLIGSHLNQISKTDIASIYWFSRLLEYFDVTLCIGGHKHTYACTYPVRENYIHYSSKATRSPENRIFSYIRPMEMERTLVNDNWKCSWYSTMTGGTVPINLTKLPLLNERPLGIDSSASVSTTDASVSDYYNSASDQSYYPVAASVHFNNSSFDGVTYFMCQATGYKLTSNKELPTQKQVFSCLIPKTTVKDDGSDKPDGSQKYPMFCTYEFSDQDVTGTSDVSIYLARIDNIMVSGAFTQSNYATGKPFLSYAYQDVSRTNNFCKWNNSSSGSEAGEVKVAIGATKMKKVKKYVPTV